MSTVLLGQQVAESQLLQAKLYIPRARPGLVPRPTLVDRLNQGARGKLTLISAPAGFGKTTLLAEWLATAEVGRDRAAWVALDQSDNEPTLFWAYFIAALQTVYAQVGTRALALLHSPQPLPVETLQGTLLNEISALPQPIVVVLDDYHLIGAQPVHQGIAFLLDHPGRIHRRGPRGATHATRSRDLAAHRSRNAEPGNRRSAGD
ncbi:MAG: hypothetical protein E6I75_26115 [Chloroflexi bacterium]|nr:MAG: hypothetical protein E6I75_26115 [Chloroflexota bacterium]